MIEGPTMSVQEESNPTRPSPGIEDPTMSAQEERVSTTAPSVLEDPTMPVQEESYSTRHPANKEGKTLAKLERNSTKQPSKRGASTLLERWLQNSKVERECSPNTTSSPLGGLNGTEVGEETVLHTAVFAVPALSGPELDNVNKSSGKIGGEISRCRYDDSEYCERHGYRGTWSVLTIRSWRDRGGGKGFGYVRVKKRFLTCAKPNVSPPEQTKLSTWVQRLSSPNRRADVKTNDSNRDEGFSLEGKRM